MYVVSQCVVFYFYNFLGVFKRKKKKKKKRKIF